MKRLLTCFLVTPCRKIFGKSIGRGTVNVLNCHTKQILAEQNSRMFRIRAFMKMLARSEINVIRDRVWSSWLMALLAERRNCENKKEPLWTLRGVTVYQISFLPRFIIYCVSCYQQEAWIATFTILGWDRCSKFG